MSILNNFNEQKLKKDFIDFNFWVLLEVFWGIFQTSEIRTLQELNSNIILWILTKERAHKKKKNQI